MKIDPDTSSLPARYRKYLGEAKPRILEEWLRRRHTPDCAVARLLVDDREWMDQFPEILTGIISALGEERASLAEQPPQSHGRQLWWRGFSADVAAFDLQLLGRILRERLEIFANAEEGISALALLRLSNRISEVLDEVVGESVATFQRIRDEQNRLREAILRRKIGSLSEELSGTLDAVEGSFHDLRGSTDILARLTDVVRRKVGDQAHSLLAALAQGLRYNQGILADLEAMSRDPVKVEPECLKVAGFVRRVWERVVFCGRTARETDVEWEATRDFPVEVDPVALERILANLMENAILHGRRGGPVRMGWWFEGEAAWRFEIENPLPPDAAVTDATGSWTEDPVFAAESTGLTVIRNLVRDMKGSLRFRRLAAGRVRVRVDFASAVGKSALVS